MKKISKKLVKFHAALHGVETRSPADNARPPLPTKILVDESKTIRAENPINHDPPESRLSDLLAEILGQLDTLSVGRAQQLAEFQELAIELSLLVAAHIVKRELDEKHLNLDDIVRTAIEQLLPAKEINVRIHPDDAIDLEAIESDHSQNLLGKIRLVQDASLSRGACLVTNEEIGLFSTIEARLESIRDTLLQGIEYARIERRTAVGIGKSLRRFPDRRQPA